MFQQIPRLPAYIKVNSDIRPQDNLYLHACSDWLSNNPRHREWADWSIANKLIVKTQQQLGDILKDWLVADPADLTVDQSKVVSYFRQLRSRYKYSQASLRSIKDIKRQLYAIKDEDVRVAKALVLAFGYRVGVKIFVEATSVVDRTNSRQYLLSIDTVSGHGGYYLADDEQSRRGRRVYLKYLHQHKKLLADMSLRYNLSPAQILKMELQTTSLDLSSGRPGGKELTFNKLSFRQFKQRFPFNWDVFFEALPLNIPRFLHVDKPDALIQVVDYINQLSVPALKAYLFSQICLKTGRYLDRAVDKLDFDYFCKYRAGIKNQPSLYKRSLLRSNDDFTDVFGREYIKRHLTAQYKSAADRIAADVKQAFAIRLLKNPWLSENSKVQATEKLKNIVINMGYSHKWRNYAAVEVDNQQIIKTFLSIASDDLRSDFMLLDHSPDRTCLGEVGENVQEVGACTSRTLLNISCPAGYLQPPFFDYHASWLHNMAMLGSTIAHELTHHFDQQGVLFDQHGNLNSWITGEERQAFKKRLQKLIKLADRHQPVDGYRQNGHQIISELLADIGGLEIVLEAVRYKFKPGIYRQQAIRATLVAYSYRFASNITREEAIYRVNHGQHPPYSYRVNGVVGHCDDFYEVFNVKPTDKLYLKPADRVQIW